ncbi:MAG: hypothetical protein ACRDSO_02735 [Pseudonocardiaceae bacterium]
MGFVAPGLAGAALVGAGLDLLEGLVGRVGLDLQEPESGSTFALRMVAPSATILISC